MSVSDRRGGEGAVQGGPLQIGTASRFRVLPWEDITGLITDADLGHAVLEQLAGRGVEVLAAG